MSPLEAWELHSPPITSAADQTVARSARDAGGCGRVGCGFGVIVLVALGSLYIYEAWTTYGHCIGFVQVLESRNVTWLVADIWDIEFRRGTRSPQHATKSAEYVAMRIGEDGIQVLRAAPTDEPLSDYTIFDWQGKLYLFLEEPVVLRRFDSSGIAPVSAAERVAVLRDMGVDLEPGRIHRGIEDVKRKSGWQTEDTSSGSRFDLRLTHPPLHVVYRRLDDREQIVAASLESEIPREHVLLEVPTVRSNRPTQDRLRVIASPDALLTK